MILDPRFSNYRVKIFEDNFKIILATLTNTLEFYELHEVTNSPGKNSLNNRVVIHKIR